MENIAKKYAAWCWGKQMPTEVSEIEKFFNRFLREQNETPILVTIDGIKKFSGEDCYAVSDNYDLLYTSILTEDYEKQGKVRAFSTKEAAEKYIEHNRPRYSLKEVVEAVNFWAMIPIIDADDVVNFFKRRGENEKK